MDMRTRCSPRGESLTLDELREATVEVDSLFEALFKCSRDLEAFNQDFFTILDSASLKSMDEWSTRPEVVAVWQVFRSIWTDIRNLHMDHLRRKSDCTSCIEKTFCPCSTPGPDFVEYRGQLQHALRNAEVNFIAKNNNVSVEDAKVLVALNPQCQLRHLPFT